MAKKKGKAKRTGNARRTPSKRKQRKRAPKLVPPPLVIQPPVEQLIEQKQREISELQARKLNYTEIPCDVSVVIPCYNAFSWLGQVVEALAYGNQSIPLKIWFCDNGSNDPLKSALTREPGITETIEWIRSLGFVGGGILDPVIQKDVDPGGTPLEPQDRINKNLEHLWKKMTMAVDTKYIWYVDGDVIPPKDSGAILRNMLDEDKSRAFVGVMYDPKTDHVKMGCSMGRTSVMKSLDFRSLGCPCRWVNYELRRRGHLVQHVEPHVRPTDTHARMVAKHGRSLGGRVISDVVEGKAG